MRSALTSIAALAIAGAAASAAPHDITPAKHATNTDEAKVGSYTLPDPLRLADGTKVRDAATWTAMRRAQVLALFEANQFGITPKTQVRPNVEPWETGVPAFGGTALRTQIRMHYGSLPGSPVVRVLLYVPAKATGPVPVLLHVGFSPNSLVVDDPGIEEGEGWNPRTRSRVPGRKALNLPGFDPKLFVGRGYAVAHVYYGDIEPDFAGAAPLGVRWLIGNELGPRDPTEWGAIGAWSWGLSRIVDYLQTNPAIDPARIALSGASRLGKTTLWAAAQDQRFSLVMPLISGEGGAALSRRDFGETIADLTDPGRYPYWFAPRYGDYAADPGKLPVDSHMLLALIAPRPMLLINGDSDTWSDWKGEILSAAAARPVYDLFGKGDSLKVVTHRGGHTILPSDLVAMADFMDREFGKTSIAAGKGAPVASATMPTDKMPRGPRT